MVYWGHITRNQNNMACTSGNELQGLLLLFLQCCAIIDEILKNVMMGRGNSVKIISPIK